MPDRVVGRNSRTAATTSLELVVSRGVSIPVGVWPPPPGNNSALPRSSDHHGSSTLRLVTRREARSRSAPCSPSARLGFTPRLIRVPPTDCKSAALPGSEILASGPKGILILGGSRVPIIEIASATSSRAEAPAWKRRHSSAPWFHIRLGWSAATARLLSSFSHRGVMCRAPQATGSAVMLGLAEWPVMRCRVSASWSASSSQRSGGKYAMWTSHVVETWAGLVIVVYCARHRRSHSIPGCLGGSRGGCAAGGLDELPADRLAGYAQVIRRVSMTGRRRRCACCPRLPPGGRRQRGLPERPRCLR